MGNLFKCTDCGRLGYTTAGDTSCPLCSPPTKEQLKALEDERAANRKKWAKK